MTEANIHLLEQCHDLLGRIGDYLYSHAPRGVAKSPVGGHVRHCLDFYNCFLGGLATGRIDYDARVRNEMVERDRKLAMAQIRTMIVRLRHMPITDDRIAVQVKMESATAWTYSCIGRELQFLLSHTVHHFALVAMLLRLQGFEPAADFGVAPSTLDSWKRKAA
ncbi:MAG: hypothetical protein ACREXT_01140 [Gammaproteobacteria bacterium]